MPKFKEYYQAMLQQNKTLFEEFRQLHGKYLLDQNKWQSEFNELGNKVIEVIYEWEDKLCNHSESSGYAKYSANLAEKFQALVRTEFPMIDYVGVVVREAKPTPKAKFVLNKINIL